LHYNVFGTVAWQEFPVSVVNKAASAAAITLLQCCPFWASRKSTIDGWGETRLRAVERLGYLALARPSAPSTPPP